MQQAPNSVSAEIRVRGEAEVRCLPDRAVLTIEVEAEAESQSQAYALAAQSAVAVDAVLDRFHQAVDRRITAGVIVRPKTRWRKGETVRTGWIAKRATVVDVTDLARLGEMVAELPSAGASALHGPVWEVDPSSPVHEQARREAALDAQRRASTYARAVGLRLGALKWMAEQGLRSDGPGPNFAAAGARTFARAEASEELMEIIPDQITIQATIDACFEVVDPGALPPGG